MAEFAESPRRSLQFQQTASFVPAAASDSDVQSGSRNGGGHPHESRRLGHVHETDNVCTEQEPVSLAVPSPEPNMEAQYEGLFSLPSRHQSMATHKAPTFSDVVVSKNLTGHGGGQVPRHGLREDDRSQSYNDLSTLATDKSSQIWRPPSLIGDGYIGVDRPMISPHVQGIAAASRFSPRVFADAKKARLFSSTTGLEDRVLMNAQTPHSLSTSKSHSAVLAEVNLRSDKSAGTLPPAHDEEWKNTRPTTLLPVDDATNHAGKPPAEKQVRVKVTITSRSAVNDTPPEDIGEDGTRFSSLTSQLDSDAPGNDEMGAPPRRTGSDTTGSVWDGLSMFSSLVDQSEYSATKQESNLFTSGSTLLPLFSRVGDEDLEELISRTKKMVETGHNGNTVVGIFGKEGGRSYLSSWRNTFQKSAAPQGDTVPTWPVVDYDATVGSLLKDVTPSGEQETLPKANRTRFYEAPKEKTYESQDIARLTKPKGEVTETEERQDGNIPADRATVRQEADTTADPIEHDAETSEKEAEMHFMAEALLDIFSLREYLFCSTHEVNQGYPYCSEMPVQDGESDQKSTTTEEGSNSEVFTEEELSKSYQMSIRDKGVYSSKKGGAWMPIRSQPCTTRNRTVFFRKDASGRPMDQECHPKKLFGDTQSTAKRDSMDGTKPHWFSAWPLRKSVRRKSKRPAGSTRAKINPHPPTHLKAQISPASGKNEQPEVVTLPSALRTPESELSSDDQIKSLLPPLTKQTKGRKKWSRKKSLKKKRVRFSEMIAETFSYSPEDPGGDKEPTPLLGKYFVAPATHDIVIERSWSGEEDDDDDEAHYNEAHYIEDWEAGCFVDSVGEFVAENFDMSTDKETMPFDESPRVIPLASQTSFDFSDYGSHV